MKSAREIVDMLGTAAKAARFFNVKPPSVQDWLEMGYIPEDRLIRYAARLEVETCGAFKRVEIWPDTYAVYWPELPPAQQNIAQPATETVANTRD
jgi:hypothetical protein